MVATNCLPWRELDGVHLELPSTLNNGSHPKIKVIRVSMILGTLEVQAAARVADRQSMIVLHEPTEKPA